MNTSTDVVQKWAHDIAPNFAVPKTLHPWQADTISLMLRGDTVALCVPTGSGKTLPQLAASLFFEDGVGIVIPPLISIEHQMESICMEWNIPCCNASNIGVTEILSSMKANRAKLLIASIELISDVTVQKAIQNLKVDYIAVDECQVMDSENGWTTFRPYVPLTWNYLRANFRTPFLLSSATMEEDSLERISDSICLDRTELKTIFKNPDRPNIYQQLRVLEEALNAGNIEQALSFLPPVIADSAFSKCQIFSTSKHLNDIVAAWLKMELRDLGISDMNSEIVEKLSGDNTKEEKQRVMDLFNSGVCKILISTDVCGMGTDVKGLNLIINLGIPRTPWKFLQQCGWAGREGQPSIAITVKFPQKGRSAPQSSLKKALCGQSCLRSEINKIFTLSSPFRDYSADNENRFECLQLGCDLLQVCDCARCSCCSECNRACTCDFAASEPDAVMEKILGVGDAKYRALKEICRARKVEGNQTSDEDEEDSFGEDDSDEGPRTDDLELSLVDLSPQYASFFSGS